MNSCLHKDIIFNYSFENSNNLKNIDFFLIGLRIRANGKLNMLDKKIYEYLKYTVGEKSVSRNNRSLVKIKNQVNFIIGEKFLLNIFLFFFPPIGEKKLFSDNLFRRVFQMCKSITKK